MTPDERLAAIGELHDEWGMTEVEDIDQLALWERLGRLLGNIS